MVSRDLLYTQLCPSNLQLLPSQIVPLLSMQSSCLLCISTLLESGNHYSKMFELTDSLGKKLFDTISISLVCGEQLQPPLPPDYTDSSLLLWQRTA